LDRSEVSSVISNHSFVLELAVVTECADPGVDVHVRIAAVEQLLAERRADGDVAIGPTSLRGRRNMEEFSAVESAWSTVEKSKEIVAVLFLRS